MILLILFIFCAVICFKCAYENNNDTDCFVFLVLFIICAGISIALLEVI